VDGGWLIPGPSEPNLVYYNVFQARNFPGTVIYQKSAALKPAPVFNPAWPFPSPVSATPAMATTPTAAFPPRTVPALPKMPPPDPYQQALDYMHSGRTDEAVKKLYEKIAKAPTFAPAYMALGKIYANIGNLEEAQQYCERAIQYDKLHPEPYYTLSMIYQQHGLHDQAVDVLKKTIYLDRQFVLAHYNLAQMYYHQNEPALARRSLQNAQRLLEGKAREELVPEGDGLIVGRLLELIASQLAEESKP
jgi:chemotaxis protein methyltransferase CheR